MASMLSPTASRNSVENVQAMLVGFIYIIYIGRAARITTPPMKQLTFNFYSKALAAPLKYSGPYFA